MKAFPLPELLMDGSSPSSISPCAACRCSRQRLVERSHARLCVVLVLLSLACFLPGFASLQPMDRDEPRYAQASKQMLETGDFVDIRFQDEARHKKPVGIYWLQSATVAAGEALGVPEARTTIALYRLPVAARRHRDRAADLLGGAGLPGPPRSLPGGGPHGDLDHPDGRGPPREDGRGARRLLRRRPWAAWRGPISAADAGAPAAR